MAVKQKAKKKTSAKKKTPVRKKATARKKVKAKKKTAVKKKPVTKRKALAKKARPKKARAKAKTKARTKAEEDYLVTKLSSLFWEAFGAAADMKVHHRCFDRGARDLDALKELRKNLDELAKFETAYKNTRRCCAMAGRRAKKLAQDEGRNEITPAIYEQAFKDIAGICLADPLSSDSTELRQVGMLC